MGLFSKLKSSINGGVQVHVQAPSSVLSNQAIPVAVNITSESTQTINSVKAEIKAVAREQGLAMGRGSGVGVQENRTMAQTVAQAESREQFTISPGETKTINLQLYLNGGVAGGTPFGQMPNLGGVLQSVVSMAQTFEHVNYTYTVHGSVDVQGHNLNPSDKQAIQILPSSESAQAPQQPQIENLQTQNQIPTVQPTPPIAELQPEAHSSLPTDSTTAGPSK